MYKSDKFCIYICLYILSNSKNKLMQLMMVNCLMPAGLIIHASNRICEHNQLIATYIFTDTQ